MRKSLIEFLPPKVAEIQDFKEITSSEDIEFIELSKHQQTLLNENFIDTASEYGIKQNELLFKIRADLLNEDMEFRRLRIKNRKLDKAPFTYTFLKNKLKNLFGEDNFKLEVLNNIYTLKVEINTFDWNIFNEIIDNFRYIIPCNMLMESTLINKIKCKLYIGACTLGGEEIIVYPWSPKDIESKGEINIHISNSTGVENITIYPRKEG